MFKYRFPLFRAFGISVHIDASWVLLALLVTWSLAVGWLPAVLPGLTASAYWMTAMIGAVGLFASILLHEMSHALVGRSFGMPMNEITLFLFGGVAHMEDEPPHAKAEFFMAIMGPLTSLFLAVVSYLAFVMGSVWQWSPVTLALLSYLFSINLLIAIFNMLPGYPLDGGRVLRSMLWGIKKDLVWATRWASSVGQGLGWALIAFGVYSLIAAANVVGGIWMIFLGMLLHRVAKASYSQVKLREGLKGQSALSVVNTQAATVLPYESVAHFVNDHVRDDQYIYPVVSEDELMGCVDLRNVRRIPKDEWDRHSVQEIMEECPARLKVDPDAKATEALSKFVQNGIDSPLMVARGRRFFGQLSARNLVKRAELRPPPATPPGADEPQAS